MAKGFSRFQVLRWGPGTWRGTSSWCHSASGRGHALAGQARPGYGAPMTHRRRWHTAPMVYQWYTLWPWLVINLVDQSIKLILSTLNIELIIWPTLYNWPEFGFRFAFLHPRGSLASKSFLDSSSCLFNLAILSWLSGKSHGSNPEDESRENCLHRTIHRSSSAQKKTSGKIPGILHCCWSGW